MVALERYARGQGASLSGRHSPPATLAQEGVVQQIMRSGQRSVIYCSFTCSFTIVVANWRLDNAKSPVAMLEEQKAAPTPHIQYVSTTPYVFLF